MSARRLLLFARAPIPGRVKTRLIAPGGMTAAGAASLHGALVEDLARRLSSGPWELVLMWALRPNERPPAGLAPPGVPWRRQDGQDLGERLYRGLRRAADGAASVAAVGSDHPDLDPARVEEAFDALAAGRDMALGPATDGGYYLIALRREAVRARLFEDIAWSTPSVLAGTLARAAELGLDVALLPEARDLDTVADLVHFREELARRAELRSLCPRTAEVLLPESRRRAAAGGAG